MTSLVMGSPEGTFDTKLHEAVRSGIKEEVCEALRQGYDPNLIGLFQWNPVHEAADNGDVEILKLLIQKKGDPNKPDYIQGRTPMHYATEKGHIDCLKLLIDNGGRYDIQDEMGKDCLDLSTPASRKILERLKVRDLMLKPDIGNGHDEKQKTATLNKAPDHYSTQSEPDSDSSRRSSVSSVQEKQPVIGYLHTSVEYHSTKQTLKIRIWQLTDILLPPPHTSGIHSIYVKSLLLPDKKRETKRKTEDIRVDSTEAHIQWKDKSSHQYIFMPSNFKFKRALEYTKINADVVKERTLQIEVLITQRYTHRSFLIGMLNMPLKKAVKKVVREKIALIPCMNHTIPSNMKVYCASELDVTSNKVFYSTPNIQITIPDGLDNASDKAASNPDLQPEKHFSSVEVNMTDAIGGIPAIPKLNLDETHLDESGYSSEFQMSVPELDSPDSDKIAVKKSHALRNSVITMPTDESDSSGKVSKVLEGVKEKLSRRTRAVTKVANGIEITDLDEEEPVSISVETDTEVTNEVSVSMKPDGQDTSRPETPTWDYYDVPADIVTVDHELPPSPWKEGAAPVVLPMETNMSIHQSKDIFSSKDGGAKPKEKVKKKSKKKNVPPIPGRAVPLVPEIVIVNTDVEQNKKKQYNHPETMVTIGDSIIKSLPTHTNSANEDNINHIVEIKEAKSVSEKVRNVANISLSTEKSTVHTTGEARAICVIEPGDPSESGQNIESNSDSLPIPKPRTKKLRKVREGGSKSGLVIPKSKLDQTASLRKVPVEKGTRLSGDSFKTDLGEIKVVTNKEVGRGDSASFVVDMDKLSFAQSGSHIVELEDDISITELSENSDLFSDTSVIYPVSVDVESGMESYKLPERVSPTKYMIPVQVYMDDDTSCDESLSTDRSERSLTIRDVPETSSKV